MRAAILRLLDDARVPYRALEHAPTRTSAESAAARGEPLEIGAKALLVKTDETFRLLVLSAARRIDSQALRAVLGVRRTRFASADELFALTGLVPGSVPPFGEPVLPFELLLDRSVTRNERVAFNAGSLCHSLILAREDYLAAARPAHVLEFTAEA